MKNPFVVKTNSPKANLERPHFFVLSKGLNSGKPLNEPCANCFIISCKTEEVKYKLFWLCFGIWQAKGFRKHLRDSVIPFISIVEIRKVLNASYSTAIKNKAHLEKSIETIKDLQEKRNQYYKSLQLIEEAKRIIMCRYIKSH